MTRDIGCEAVLFDCDGVLVDSVASWEGAWSRWALEYGLVPDEVLGAVQGRRSTDTVTMFLPAAEHAAGLARIDALEIADAPSVRPVAGVAELLEEPPAAWAVVTSASKALLLARLAGASLPLSSVIVTAEDVTIGKPAPDGYLLAARALGVSISDCVVVEDSAAGVEAGRAAGAIHVLGVGVGALGTDADTVVRDLSGTRWYGGALRIAEASLLRPS